jgi:predicted ATPase
VLDLSAADKVILKGLVPTASLSANDQITLAVDTDFSSNWNEHRVHFVDDRGIQQNVIAYPTNVDWQGLLRSFFSEAGVSFAPVGITGAGASSLDDAQVRRARSGENIATQIAQLIVDIRAADAEDLSNWVTANPGSVPPASIQHARFSRFERAFNYMFTHKRFKGVRRLNGQILIEFEEFGRVSTIDKLSTGEKQIVFRGGFLLKDLANIPDSIVLVDEPELSLHPEWQGKIVEFYKTILTDDAGNQPQLFIATHSPFIVHGAANSKIIIMEKNPSTGNVAAASNPYYPAPMGSEAVRAFNILPFLRDSQTPMLILTEGDSDATILATAWEKLRPGLTPFFDIRAALGDKNLQITLNDQQTISKNGNRLLLGIFDFDSAYNQWNGLWRSSSSIVSSLEADGIVKRHDKEKAWSALLPVPSFRSGYASQILKGLSILSIEFLFEDKDIPQQMVGYKPLAMGQTQPFFIDKFKTSFAAMVKTLPPLSFGGFEPLIARIEDIYSGKL